MLLTVLAFTFKVDDSRVQADSHWDQNVTEHMLLMLPLKMKKSIYFLAEIKSGRPGSARVVSGAEKKII